MHRGVRDRLLVFLVVLVVLQLALLATMTVFVAGLCAVHLCLGGPVSVMARVVAAELISPTVTFDAASMAVTGRGPEQSRNRDGSAPVVRAAASATDLAAGSVVLPLERIVVDGPARSGRDPAVPAGRVTRNVMVGSRVVALGMSQVGRPVGQRVAQPVGLRAPMAVNQSDPNRTDDLPTVISNATKWLRGIAGALTILLLTVAGILRVMAREPSDMDKARQALSGACAGFVIALMAPQFVVILRGILGAGNG